MIYFKDRKIGGIYVKTGGVVREISEVYNKDILVYQNAVLPEIPTYLNAVYSVFPDIPTGIILEKTIILTYENLTQTSLTLNWTAPFIKNKVPQTYQVVRDGSVLGSTTNQTVDLSNNNPGQTYTYKVRAQFTDGTWSSFSNIVTVKMDVYDIAWLTNLFDVPFVNVIELYTDQPYDTTLAIADTTDFTVLNFDVTGVSYVANNRIRLTIYPDATGWDTVSASYVRGANLIYSDDGLSTLPNFTNQDCFNNLPKPSFDWSFGRFTIEDVNGNGIVTLYSNQDIREGDPLPIPPDFTITGGYTFTTITLRQDERKIILTLSSLPNGQENLLVSYAGTTNLVYNDIGEILPNFSYATLIDNLPYRIPIELTYRDVTDTTLTLDWTAADTSGGKVEEQYEVWMDGSLIGTGGVIYTIDLGGRTPGETYVYSVRCKYTDQTFSPYSNEVSVTMENDTTNILNTNLNFDL